MFIFIYYNIDMNYKKTTTILAILLWFAIAYIAIQTVNTKHEKSITPLVPMQVQDYSWRDIQCQNLRWIVTQQTWQYVYIEWSWTNYDYNDEYAYKWRQHISECYFEPKDIYEELQNSIEWYEWVFQDDKRFACRQMVTQPLQLIQKWQCENFIKSDIKEWSRYSYECDIKMDDYSSYPLFCI